MGMTSLPYKLQQLMSMTNVLIIITSICLFYIIYCQTVVDKNPAQAMGNLEETNDTEVVDRHTKYLLFWTPDDYYPLNALGTGKKGFIKCPVANCYATADRNFFDGDLTRFHAIAFEVRNMQKEISLPQNRSSDQIYIFFASESSDNYPVCSKIYDGLFNWTATYKLESDIPWPYFHVLNQQGQVVAPKPEVKWIKRMASVDQKLLTKFRNKTKMAAWFVSNCRSRSNRQEYVKKLQSALETNGSHVYVFGDCGPYECPRNNEKYCDEKLEEEFFFYLALENSFADDYVTEKVLRAMQHFVVPVVFGGANYSRFLPPNSYVDARAYSPEELARHMSMLSQSPKLYSEYFRWRNHYTIISQSHVCAVCAALNNKTKMQTKNVYRHFRAWWNPNFKKRCS